MGLPPAGFSSGHSEVPTGPLSQQNSLEGKGSGRLKGDLNFLLSLFLIPHFDLSVFLLAFPHLSFQGNVSLSFHCSNRTPSGSRESLLRLSVLRSPAET